MTGIDSNGRAQVKVTQCDFKLLSHAINLEGGNSEEYMVVIEEFIAKYKNEVSTEYIEIYMIPVLAYSNCMYLLCFFEFVGLLLC